VPSSIPPAASAIEDIAELLLATRPLRTELLRGGGNNQIYRVETANGPVALKGYKVADGDTRDRLGQEWAALSLVAGHLPDLVPRPIAVDRKSGWAAYEWIEGVRPVDRTHRDVDSAVDFLERLQALRAAPEAEALALASEACLSLDELCGQIRRRLDRLAGVAGVGGFVDQIAARLAELHGSSPELPENLRILSPSDFGFHNALRRPDGRLVFLDFEYFGWDDPAKLASDIHWHPGMALTAGERDRFAAGLARIFGSDPGYQGRLRVYRPLIGLRWCLILLNEFLPQGLARRRHAGQAEDVEAAQARQLAKARALYSEVVQGL
jgi:hypothetical protein